MVALAASQACAQTNDGPVCTAKIVTVTESRDGAVNIVINPIQTMPACVDATGHQMTLTTVTPPAYLNPASPGFPPNTMTIANDLQPGQSRTIDFTVTDENGLSTTSSLTLTRPETQN